MYMLQSLGMYIKSKQDYERERSLYITSILLTECLSCAKVLAVSLSSVELICLGFFVVSCVLLILLICYLVLVPLLLNIVLSDRLFHVFCLLYSAIIVKMVYCKK